jgi:glycosyltransferase A (GT-A) superfamily protein (DUF2064 family)
MAKAPFPGRVKTRLSPPYSLVEAATIAEAALADTLDAVSGCHADRKFIALDGAPGPWLPRGVEVINQRGCGFDERLANAWADTRRATGGWGVQIGADTPQVTARLLDQQLTALAAPPSGAGSSPPAVLGAAADGGWWLIGLPGTDPNLVFAGVPMSTSRTGSAQAARLRSLGLGIIAGPVLRDIDTALDLGAVVAEIPESRTAAATRQLASPLHKRLGSEVA